MSQQILDALNALLAEQVKLRTEIARLREEVTAVRLLVESPEQLALPFPPQAAGGLGESDQLVNLNQIAAIVYRSTSALRHYIPVMPRAELPGRRNRPALWRWSAVRPWLEQTFGRQLPEAFPTTSGG
jgi:hypothetical protein